MARRAYSELLEEQATLDRAIEIGGKLHEELRIRSRAELGEARAEEHAAAMRRQCLALIEFEHEAQAVDAIIHDSTSHRRYRGEVGGEVRFVDVAPHNMNEQIGKQLLLSARANR